MKKKIAAAVCALALAVSMAGGASFAGLETLTKPITASAGGGSDYEWNGFQYDLYNGNVWIFGYDGTATDVVVPSTIGGKTVEYVGFFGKYNSIYIPPTVTKIDGIGNYIDIDNGGGIQKYSSMIIKGQAGSTAQTYASENGFRFQLATASADPGTVTVSAPAAPTGMKTAAAGRNAVKLSWNSSSGATGYALYKYNPVKKGYEVYGVTKTNSIMVAGLSSGTTYAFTARAYKTYNGKNYWSGFSGNYYASTIPENVIGIKAAKTGYTAIQLTWNKTAGASGYVVYKYNPTKKAYERYAVTKTNSRMITGLTDGTSYFFTVKAYRTFGGANLYSPGYGNFLTSTCPYKVSFTALSPAKNKVSVNWSKVRGADTYVIYHKLQNGSWSRIGTVNGNTTSYTATGVPSGNGYITVRAFRTVNGKTFGSPNFDTALVRVQ